MRWERGAETPHATAISRRISDVAKSDIYLGAENTGARSFLVKPSPKTKINFDERWIFEIFDLEDVVHSHFYLGAESSRIFEV